MTTETMVRVVAFRCAGDCGDQEDDCVNGNPNCKGCLRLELGGPYTCCPLVISAERLRNGHWLCDDCHKQLIFATEPVS